jgi:hypothetical protein
MRAAPFIRRRRFSPHKLASAASQQLTSSSHAKYACCSSQRLVAAQSVLPADGGVLSVHSTQMLLLARALGARNVAFRQSHAAAQSVAANDEDEQVSRRGDRGSTSLARVGDASGPHGEGTGLWRISWHECAHRCLRVGLRCTGFSSRAGPAATAMPTTARRGERKPSTARVALGPRQLLRKAT